MIVELLSQLSFSESCIAAVAYMLADDLQGHFAFINASLEEKSWTRTYSDRLEVSANSVRSVLSRLLRYVDVEDMLAMCFYCMRQLMRDNLLCADYVSRSSKRLWRGWEEVLA